MRRRRTGLRRSTRHTRRARARVAPRGTPSGERTSWYWYRWTPRGESGGRALALGRWKPRGDGDGEARARAGVALGGDVAAVGFDDAAGDREAEADAARGAGAAAIAAEKRLEDAG